MSYSFFGTCADDQEQFFCCLETILNQTILPKEIILVNSGKIDFKKEISDRINNKEINLVYIFRKLSRVKSLNIGLDKSTAEYSFRFDSRSRFSSRYAENALKVLNDKSLDTSVVGGIPKSISEKDNYESNICSAIMNRSYIFFYPKHRRIKFNGFSSSIYLGCFKTKLLKEIKFNEKRALISEDSLIINSFLEKGFKAYLSSHIKVNYVSRSKFWKILKLFNTYGFCRSNTILISKKVFISSRHLLVFISLILLMIIIGSFSIIYLTTIPIALLLINVFGEIFTQRKSCNLQIPFYATLCQFSWIFGFLWNLFCILKKKTVDTNFIS